MQYFYQFKLFWNGKVTGHSTFPVLWHFTLCLMVHVSSGFACWQWHCQCCAVYLRAPYLWGGGGGGGHALYPEVPCGAESMVQSCIENKKTNEVSFLISKRSHFECTCTYSEHSWIIVTCCFDMVFWGVRMVTKNAVVYSEQHDTYFLMCRVGEGLLNCFHFLIACMSVCSCRPGSF